MTACHYLVTELTVQAAVTAVWSKVLKYSSVSMENANTVTPEIIT